MVDRPRADFEAFVRVAQVLSSSLDLDAVLGELLAGIDDLLRPTHWSLLLREEEGDGLVFRLVGAAGDPSLCGVRLAPGEGIAGWVVQTGQSLVVRDPASDPRFSGRVDELIGFDTRSIVAVPLRAGGRVLGVIELVNELEAGDFSSDDLRLLEAYADFAAIALRNASAHGELLEASRSDPLTGLRNSRYFLACAQEAVQGGEPFALVFFDMDHFKAMVDRHGHVCGSAALAEVGAVLREMLGPGEIGCRFGGDEFAFLLPGADATRAAERSRKFAREIESRCFLTARNLAIRLGASFGWAAFPEDAREADALLRCADERMYAAKRAARRARQD